MEKTRKLKIKFRCLCFFVRDEETGLMHVVTPATCACEEGGVDQHEAYVVFPKKGGRLNDKGNFKDPGEVGLADYERMEGFAMVLPSNGTSAVLDFRPSIVNVNGLTGDTVNPTLVRGPRDKRITSRITLPSGKMTSAVTPATWKLPGMNKIALARDVIWTIDNIPAETLMVRRSPFEVGKEPGAEEDLIEILPNSRGEFRLEIHHPLKGDFGRPLEERDPEVAARHFHAYYGLYDQPGSTPDLVSVSVEDEGSAGCVGSGGTVRSAK